jgi:hypothetical protein
MRPPFVATLLALTVVLFAFGAIVIAGGCAEGAHPMSCPPHSFFADPSASGAAWRTPVKKVEFQE